MLIVNIVTCSVCGGEFETKARSGLCRRCASGQCGKDVVDSEVAPRRAAPAKHVKRGMNKMVLFGNTSIYRRKCRVCGGAAFVIDGKLTCCGVPVNSVPKGFIRECEPVQCRKSPPVLEKKRLLELQENRCFYCGVAFGSIHIRNGKPIKIMLNWDHQLPYAYSQNNKTENFVAACHVCNGIKCDKIFRDVEEAQVYLTLKRAGKGYDF